MPRRINKRTNVIRKTSKPIKLPKAQNLNNYTRKELQGLCKLHGIKGNITTDNMNKYLPLAIAGKNIPKQFKRQTLFDKYGNIVTLSLSICAFIMAGVSLFYGFK